MKIERIFSIKFLVILATCLVFVSGANADPGVKFWATDVGNYWVYDGSDPWGSWTWRDEISGTNTTTIPGIKTYKNDGYEDGLYAGSKWFSISSTEIKHWKEVLWDDVEGWITIIGKAGLVWAKNPIIVGDHWSTTTTGTMSGTGWNYPVDISLDVTIQAYESVTIPLGTYKAYKGRQIFHVWNSTYGINETLTEYRWFVPYLGVVKWQDGSLTETEVLASMNIKKGIVDFECDGKTDVAVYHSASGLWFIKKSSDGTSYYVGYGGSAYVPVPGDYDGDGKIDVAVYHSPSGLWFIKKSSNGTSYYVGYGGSAYIPVPGDYDGDGKTDVAVYHSSSGLWFIKKSSDGTSYYVGYGGSDYKPVPGDYDGDGKTDIAVYHSPSGLWFIKKSSDGTSYYVGYGGTDYKPAPGDYDGDGKTDIAVYHSPSGLWFIKKSSDGASYYVGYGGPDYMPVNLVYLHGWVY